MASDRAGVLRELRGLLADYLLFWAFKLDHERFVALDEDGRRVVEMWSSR